MARWLKGEITQPSMKALAAGLVDWIMRTPMRPVRVPTVPLAPVPLIERLRSRTVRVGSSVVFVVRLILTPFVPLARIEPKPPPNVPSMVIDFVMVIVPKPPSSRQSISPLIKVFEMAPANVLHGAVRLQGLTSSPTPDTQVRVACACAMDATINVNTVTARIFKVKRTLLMMHSPYLGLSL